MPIQVNSLVVDKEGGFIVVISREEETVSEVPSSCVVIAIELVGSEVGWFARLDDEFTMQVTH